jgi:hypothetical protein
MTNNEPVETEDPVPSDQPTGTGGGGSAPTTSPSDQPTGTGGGGGASNPSDQPTGTGGGGG